MNIVPFVKATFGFSENVFPVTLSKQCHFEEVRKNASLA